MVVYSGFSAWDQALVHQVSLNVGSGGVGALGWQHGLLGVAGDQESAASEGHELGDLLWLKDMCNAFFIFVGAPVVEVAFVVDGSRLGEIVDRINDGACLLVAIVKGLDIFLGPVCPVHVVKWLCMSQLGLDLLVEKGDAIFGFVVLLEQVGCVDLQVLEKFIGGGLWPFHEVQEVVHVWSVTVDEALGNHLAHGLGLALGLDDQALFGSKERVPLVILVGPWSVVGEASWA